MEDYTLIGRNGLSSTEKARELLDGAGINYHFAQADIDEGVLPQLIGGLTAFIGLEQIARAIYRHKRRALQPELV